VLPAETLSPVWSGSKKPPVTILDQSRCSIGFTSLSTLGTSLRFTLVFIYIHIFSRTLVSEIETPSVNPYPLFPLQGFHPLNA